MTTSQPPRALAWLLVPGACLLANRLATLSPVIDELVAAQLWIEVRTFGPGGGRRVAATILRNTRKGVLRELGVGDHAEPAWQRCLVLDTSRPGAGTGRCRAHPDDSEVPGSCPSCSNGPAPSG